MIAVVAVRTPADTAEAEAAARIVAQQVFAHNRGRLLA